MKSYSIHEVFIPGGMPTLTYISRTSVGLENKLKSFQKKHHKFISVTGTTKSGKTVLVNKFFPRDKTVWFDGGTFSNEDSFWIDICEQLNAYTTKTIETNNTSTFGAEVETEGKIGISVFFAAIKNKLTTSCSRSKGKSQSISIPSKNIAISNLRKSSIPLIIDDFHYLKMEDQKSILRALKPIVFDGLPVILISIPHRKFDVLKAERELTGRNESIEVPPWEDKELLQIATIGFPLLNIDIINTELEILAKETFGSPHLMQELCLELCNYEKIDQTLNKQKKVKISKNTKPIFHNVAENTGRPVFEKIKKGPRSRTDRIKRKLKNGTETDIYGVMLAALSNLKPGLVTLNYETLRMSIREVANSIPQSNEISRVLEHMAKISFNDNSSTPVLDWEKEEGLLHITDPFFSFFLRWGDLN